MVLFSFFLNQGWAVSDFGVHRLKGIEKAEHIYSVLPGDLSERVFIVVQDLLCNRCKASVRLCLGGILWQGKCSCVAVHGLTDGCSLLRITWQSRMSRRRHTLMVLPCLGFVTSKN